MQLIIIGIVALALVAAAVAWREWTLRPGRKVVVNLDDETVWSGTIVRASPRFLTLRRASAGSDEQARRADGRIVLPRRRIELLQVLG